MALSIQTNVSALTAQENLRVNSEFQARTIQRLTSGFRINSSGDDAAGLAVANKFRADVMELSQGVRNANDGVSQLQIIDGGINNIAKILDRMTTLATQSASDTFSGGVAGRNTLNNEYQTLMSELTRQANNIGLGTGAVGGRFNKSIAVYTGGGMGTQSNAQVSIDLAGTTNQIDAAGLGLTSTKINGAAGVAVGNVNIKSGSTFYAGNDTQDFTFDLAGGGQVVATVTGTATGISGQDIVAQLNSQLQSSGITASINDTTGFLEFSSSRGFMASVAGGGPADGAATAAVAVGAALAGGNKAMYYKGFTLAGGAAAQAQTLTFKIGTTTVATVSVANGAGETAGVIDAKIRAALSGTAIDYVSSGTTGALFSSSQFTVTSDVTAANDSVITAIDGGANELNDATALTDYTAETPTLTGDGVASAKSALTALSDAVSRLSSVSGKVGTAQNMLQYAISLAQSQITNFSAAESRIRDTDVAAEAANLTKAQVLQQASMAALAQANSAPQAVLALLRG
jgi:flagellin